MSQQIDLREVERKSFAVRFQDGLLDVWLGFLLLAGVLPEALSGGAIEGWATIWAYSVLSVVGYAAFWAARKYISEPRIGRMKPGPAGKRRLGRTALLMIASLIFSVALVALTAVWPALSGGSSSMFSSSAQVASLVAAWMLVIFSVASFVLNFSRGYLIGVLYALGLGLGLLLDSPVPTIVAGGLLVLLGLFIFARFVRGNPLPGEEGANASI